MVTCVVVAYDPEVRSIIDSAFGPLAVQTVGISSLAELPAVVTTTPVAGILLELATSVKSSPHEKELTSEYISLFPFARFRLAGPEIRILGDEKSMEEFAQRCLRYRPRVARRDSREPRFLAVHLSPDDRMQDPEKTVTINVGRGGCFVYSHRDWKIGDSAWLRFPGNDTVFSGTVRFWQPWGNDKAIPGIGIQFDRISPWA